MRRKLVALGGFATGALVGTVLYRRSAQRQRERVVLSFDDGSMLSLSDGSPATAQLLSIARSILTASRAGG